MRKFKPVEVKLPANIVTGMPHISRDHFGKWKVYLPTELKPGRFPLELPVGDLLQELLDQAAAYAKADAIHDTIKYLEKLDG